MGPGRPRRRRTQDDEEVSDAFYSGTKAGAIFSTDIQVAINNGNRREDVFFMARVGKSGTSGPFQQPIPQDFARHHPDLHQENVTLENAGGDEWVVTVRPTTNVVRFGKGWRAFSRDNNLREGHQLIFTRIERLHFKVTVYDCRGKSLGQPPNGAEASPQKATLSDPRGKAHSEHPNVAEASPPKASGYGSRGKALAEPPNVAEATSLTAMPLQPLNVAAKTDYPLTRPAVLDSKVARIILRDILPPPPPCQFPDAHITAALTNVPVPIPAPDVDGARVVAPTEEQNVTGVGEGKDSIFQDRDEDGDLGLLGVGMTTLPNSKRKVVAKPGCGVSESDDSDDDDLPLTRLLRLPRRGSGAMMNRGNYESATQKKICVRRPSWKGERMNLAPPQKAPTLASALFPITRSKKSKHQEIGESSKGPLVAVEEEDDDDGEAVRLKRQQGRKNFSDIVCTHRQHYVVSGRDKKCALDAAMEFSSELANQKFVAVMYAAQVYHGFYLPIPAEILEATGTQGAKVVQAWLTDKDKQMYMVNWAWSRLCETPLLNNNGWAKFALDHFLNEGDVCVFKLVNSNSAPTSRLLFQVHIFRAKQGHRDGFRALLAKTFPGYQ